MHKTLDHQRLKRFWDKAFPYIFTCIFIVLSVILISKHELWSDEVHAWLVGAESKNIQDLIANMRTNEGHPYLWNLILYFVSHFITRDVNSIKVIHLIFSSCTAFLILKFSPFNKIIKSSLVFSYFLFYEYSIISRNYALGILLIILFCVFFKNYKKNIIYLSIVIFFMMHLNLYSLIFSILLFGILFQKTIFMVRENPSKKNFTFLFLSILIFLSGIALIYWQLGQQALARISNDTSIYPFIVYRSNDIVANLVNISKGIISAFLPIPIYKIEFWNTNLVFTILSNANMVLNHILAFILFLVPIFIIDKKKIIYFILGSAAFLLVPTFIYKAGYRHYGHIFVLFIVLLWLSEYSGSNMLIRNLKFRSILKYSFLGIIISASLVGSLFASYFEYRFPFSQGKEVSSYIEQELDVNDLKIISYPGGRGQVISAYLDKDLYYSQLETYQKLVLMDQKVDKVKTNKELFKEAHNFFQRGTDSLLVIVSTSYVEPSQELRSRYDFEKIELGDVDTINNEEYELILFSKKSILEKYNAERLYDIDHRYFEKTWEYFSDCSYEIKDNNIIIRSEGKDPHFESKIPFNINNDEGLFIFINTQAAAEDEFQIYYKSRGADYSEGNSITRYLLKGYNEIYFKLPKIGDLDKIRIDPLKNPGSINIESIEIYTYSQNP